MAGEWDWTRYSVGGAQRPDSFSGMQPQFASALQQLFMSAPPEVQQNLRVGSGFRSVDRQAQLWDEALKKYGSPEAARKWVAPPGNSQHNHGNAADLKFLGDNAREWAHANAANFGLSFPLSNENWHVELANARGEKPAGPTGPYQSPFLASTPQVATPGPETPAPGPSPFLGDLVAPQQAAAAPGIGDVVAAFMQSRRQRDAEAEAEQARRQALFAAMPSPFG